MKTILLLGQGAREHQLAVKLKESKRDILLIGFGSYENPGLLETVDIWETLDPSDPEAVMEALARLQEEDIELDFAVVGPDAVLETGTVDALMARGVPCIGPNKFLAQLETSKSFTRALLEKHGIEGNPAFQVFQKGEKEALEAFAQSLEAFVVKADGLCGGKGVSVMGDHFANHAEGVALAQAILEKEGRVVIEEKLIGEEFSAIYLCDGHSLQRLTLVQDHKRAFDGDQGPNTGGMGTYSYPNGLLPFLEAKDIEDGDALVNKVLQALKKESPIPYVGLIYAGFMAVKKGVKLIEFNARFGDPEVFNVLQTLNMDLVQVFEAMIRGRLHELPFHFHEEACLVHYLVPEGYPEKGLKGAEVKQIAELPAGVKLFIGSIEQEDEESPWRTLGSRALALVALAPSLEEAYPLLQEAKACFEGPLFSRKDIGSQALLDARVARMKQIRENS